MTNQEAICSGTEAARDLHTAALVAHGEAIIGVGAGEVLVTGNTLIQALDKGCDT